MIHCRRHPPTPNPNFRATLVPSTRRVAVDSRSAPPEPRGGAAPAPSSSLLTHPTRRLQARLADASESVVRSSSNPLPPTLAPARLNKTSNVNIEPHHTYHLAPPPGARPVPCVPRARYLAPCLPILVLIANPRSDLRAPHRAFQRVSSVDRSWTDVRGRSSQPPCYCDVPARVIPRRVSLSHRVEPRMDSTLCAMIPGRGAKASEEQKIFF